MNGEVQILEQASGEFVAASLIEAVTPADLAEAEGQWSPVRQILVDRLRSQGLSDREIARRLQHSHWNWVAKVPHLMMLGVQCIGIKADDQWQGLAMLEAATKFASLPPDQNKPLVYIDYLETAPWNLREFIDRPRYGGVGMRLMEYAVRYSLEQGFHGRVGLFSLPQAEAFYEQRCQMVRMPQIRQGPMCWFELTRQGATAFLTGGA